MGALSQISKDGQEVASLLKSDGEMCPRRWEHQVLYQNAVHKSPRLNSATRALSILCCAAGIPHTVEAAVLHITQMCTRLSRNSPHLVGDRSTMVREEVGPQTFSVEMAALLTQPEKL